MIDIRSVVCVTFSITYAIYIRSAVCFIKSVVHVPFFDQLCLIFGQMCVLFNYLYIRFFRSVVFDIRSVAGFFFSISSTCDFFGKL